MRTVHVAWDAAGERFTAQGRNEGHIVVASGPRQPVEAGGHAEPTGFSPTELLLAGAGACAAWDVIEICRKQRRPLSGLEVAVEGEQEPQAPWAYQRVRLRFMAWGAGLDVAQLDRAAGLAVERYCSVLATLRGVASIDYEVVIVADPATPAA